MADKKEMLDRWPFERKVPSLPPQEYARRREQCPISKVRMWDGSNDSVRNEMRAPILRSDLAFTSALARPWRDWNLLSSSAVCFGGFRTCN